VVRSVSALLLSPAVAVLDRLRLARKLVVIALVLIAPALYATWQLRSQQNASIAFSSKERVGVREIVPAGQLLTELANTRALAVRSAGGDAEATAALPAARKAVAFAVAALDAADRGLAPELGTATMWSKLRTSIQSTVASRPTDALAALDAYDRLTAGTLELIVQAGNASNLILDPDLDSYYAMDALVNKVPLALDTAGRVTSREIAMVASEHSTEAERIQLAVDQGVMESAVDAVHSGLKTAYAETSDPQMKKTLAGPLALISGSTPP
jgi:methyl-accepting chemotaxis protein